MQEETDCKLHDPHLSLNVRFHQQVVDNSNESGVQEEAATSVRGADGMTNKNSDVASMGAKKIKTNLDVLEIDVSQHSDVISETSHKALDTAGLGFGIDPSKKITKSCPGDASYLSPVAISQCVAVEDCIDGRVDGHDDEEVAESCHETGPPIGFDSPISPFDDSADVLKVADTVTEQCGEEAMHSLQSDIMGPEHMSEVLLDRKSVV